MSTQLEELMRMFMRIVDAEKRWMNLKPFSIGGYGPENECGERLWYPTRIWNNQEDR